MSVAKWSVSSRPGRDLSRGQEKSCAPPSKNEYWLTCALIGVLIASSITMLPTRVPSPLANVSVAGLLCVAEMGVLWVALICFAAVERTPVRVVPFALFAAYATVGLAWAPASTGSFQEIVVYWSFVAALMIVSSIKTGESTRRLLFAFAVGQWICVFLWAISLATATGLVSSRVAGLFSVLAAAVAVSTASSRKLWVASGAATGMVLALLSISRTVTLAFGVIYALAYARTSGGVSARRLLLAGCALAVCGAALVISSDAVHERLFGRDASLGFGGLAINAEGRTVVWAEVWDSAWEKPIGGHGVGSAKELSINLRHPHNEVLRLFHDHGVIGLTLFWLGIAWYAAPCFRALFRKRDVVQGRDWALTGSCATLAFIFGMVTDNVLNYYYVMMPYAIIIGLANTRVDLRGGRSA